MKQERHITEEKPTLLQLRYLRELMREPEGKVKIQSIASRCGVNHSSVSRYFKSCRDAGILDENYRFTGQGKAWFEEYLQLYQEVTDYVARLSSPLHIRSNVKELMENLDLPLLRAILTNDHQQQKLNSLDKKNKMAKNYLENTLEYGVYDVHFLVFMLNEQDRGKLSMANRGIKNPARLVANKRGSWLELEICEMQASSRSSGKIMQGHLYSLKYEMSGVLWRAPIRKGKTRIPLEAFYFENKPEGKINASLTIFLSCSVGKVHMPESMALLTFYM